MAEGWSAAVIEPQREAVVVTKSNKKPLHKLLLALGEWGSVRTLARLCDSDQSVCFRGTADVVEFFRVLWAHQSRIRIVG